MVVVFLFLSSCLLQAEEMIVNGMAAIVNNEVITFSQVRELVAMQERSVAEALQGQQLADKIKAMHEAAIKDLIDRTLILQEFKKKGYSIPEYMVDDRIQKVIREEFGGDRAAFVKTLQSQGFSVARFRQVQKDNIIVSSMRAMKQRENYVVSPLKVRSFYDKNRATYTTPEQIKLRMIVLHKEEENGSAPQAISNKRTMADEIRQKIAAGAEFDRMAQMYSEDSTQDSGGDWGWIERKTLNDDLAKAAFSMKAGEVSSVIEVGDSYYILMVEAIKNASVKPYSEVQRSIEQHLIEEEMVKGQAHWLKGLREKAYIKIL